MNIFNLFKNSAQSDLVETIEIKQVEIPKEPSCIVKTILKDLEDIGNFDFKTINDDEYKETERGRVELSRPEINSLIHKTRKYELRYWYAYGNSQEYTFSIEGINTWGLFRYFEKVFISEKIKQIELKRQEIKKVKQDQEDAEKLKQWFPECYREEDAIYPYLIK